MAFGWAKKGLGWLAGQTDFHADAPGTGPGQRAIQAQMAQAASRGRSQAQSMAASARGSSSPLALREAQRQAAFANQAAAQQGAIASSQLEQQRLQNIMEQQRINAGIAQGNAGGIMKLAGLAVGGAALASDERTKNIEGGYFDARSKMDAQEEADRQRRKQGLLGLSSYMQGGTDSPFAVSDARAKTLESENEQLKSKLGALALGGASVLNPSMVLPGVLAAHARRKTDSMGHTPAPAPGRPQLQAQETQALAPSEAEALAIVRAREVAKQKALERDLAGSAEAQAAAANERGQIAMLPGSGSRQAELGRRLSDDRMKYSDEEMKAMGGMAGMDHERMQFPAGVKPVHFTYKPEAQAAFGVDDKQHVGLLAQDLEKSPEGATAVEEDPATGMKMVDTQDLTMLTTAKLSEMEKRLKRLEAKRGKRS